MNERRAAIAGGATLAGIAGGIFLLVSRGRLTLDLGWGRTLHPLGPIVVQIDAPRETVFQVAAAPYMERAPAAVREKVRIVHRGGDLVVAAHRTALPVMDAITVEAVLLEPPSRITFDLLRGPVPFVTEEYVLEGGEGSTTFTYRGQLGADLWGLGRLYGGRIVRPLWERVVAESIASIKLAAEERATRASGRRSGRGGESPSTGPT